MKKIIVLAVLTMLTSGLLAGVPGSINYQGRVFNPAGSATPVADGVYNVTYTLYDDPTSGTADWTGNTTAHTKNGLFSNVIGPISGIDWTKEYWVQVTFDGEVMAPRQKLWSVPYAQRAQYTNQVDLNTTVYGPFKVSQPASGALAMDIQGTALFATSVTIAAETTEPVLFVKNTTGLGVSIQASNSYEGLWAGGKHGVHGSGQERGLWGEGGTYGVWGEGSSYGVYGTGPTYGIWGSSSGRGVYGSGAYGVYGSGTSYGLYGTSTNYGVYGTSSSSTSAGVRGYNSGSGPGVSADGYYGVSATSNNMFGIYGKTTSTSPGAAGVMGYSETGDGVGVKGTGSEVGVMGDSWIGVQGISTNKAVVGTGGATGVSGTGTTDGVYGHGGTYGVSGYGTSYGVYGYGGTYGVRGEGTSYGVYGRTTTGSYAIYGYNSGGIAGVYGYGSTAQTGVYGTGASTTPWGVWGKSSAAGGAGVFAESSSSAGYGLVASVTSTAAAVYGRNAGLSGGTGVEGYVDDIDAVGVRASNPASNNSSAEPPGAALFVDGLLKTRRGSYSETHTNTTTWIVADGAYLNHGSAGTVSSGGYTQGNITTIRLYNYNISPYSTIILSFNTTSVQGHSYSIYVANNYCYIYFDSAVTFGGSSGFNYTIIN